jgi:hypothetical protein
LKYVEKASIYMAFYTNSGRAVMRQKSGFPWKTIILSLLLLFGLSGAAYRGGAFEAGFGSLQLRYASADDGLNLGKDAVVVGRVPPNSRIGDGSVVIGPTDSNGNVILNAPMAAGRCAYAGPGSISIGAGAGAGSLPKPCDVKP